MRGTQDCVILLLATVVHTKNGISAIHQSSSLFTYLFIDATIVPLK